MKMLFKGLFITAALGCFALQAIDEEYITSIKTTEPRATVGVITDIMNLFQAQGDPHAQQGDFLFFRSTHPGEFELEKPIPLALPGNDITISVINPWKRESGTPKKDVFTSFDAHDQVKDNDSGKWQLIIGKDSVTFAKA